MNSTKTENTNNLVNSLQDYMFTSKNLNIYTKNMVQIDLKPKSIIKNYKHDTIISEPINSEPINIKPINSEPINIKPIISEPRSNEKISQPRSNEKISQPRSNEKIIKEKEKENDIVYRPKQKDSLFWCFYILKNGYSNYEMEINGQYFTVEKKEKFKYIDMIRKNKDILKIHKIKPLTELEDDLANKERISVKTFFALCILENINVILVDKRKIIELLCVDIDDKHPVNIIHRNNQTYDHHIELIVTPEILQKYRETYYKMANFDSTLKAIGSYNLEELTDLCKKLNINIEPSIDKKKKTKKDIYELLVLNY